jgi:hypothetical protein
MHIDLKRLPCIHNQGFPKLIKINVVAISQVYYQLLSTLKAGCKESNGKNWLLNLGTSSQRG